MMTTDTQGIDSDLSLLSLPEQLSEQLLLSVNSSNNRLPCLLPLTYKMKTLVADKKCEELSYTPLALYLKSLFRCVPSSDLFTKAFSNQVIPVEQARLIDVLFQLRNLLCKIFL